MPRVYFTSYFTLNLLHLPAFFRSGNAGLIISNQYSYDWIGRSQSFLQISKITNTCFSEREFFGVGAGREGHSLYYLPIYQNILLWANKQWTLVLRIGGGGILHQLCLVQSHAVTSVSIHPRRVSTSFTARSNNIDIRSES